MCSASTRILKVSQSVGSSNVRCARRRIRIAPAGRQGPSLPARTGHRASGDCLGPFAGPIRSCTAWAAPCHENTPDAEGRQRVVPPSWPNVLITVRQLADGPVDYGDGCFSRSPGGSPCRWKARRGRHLRPGGKGGRKFFSISCLTNTKHTPNIGEARRIRLAIEHGRAGTQWGLDHVVGAAVPARPGGTPRLCVHGCRQPPSPPAPSGPP